MSSEPAKIAYPKFLAHPVVEIQKFRDQVVSAYVKLQDRKAVRDTQPNPTLPVFFPFTTLAGLDLVSTGIRMPPVLVVEAPVAAPQSSGIVNTPVEELPPPVVVPLPRKPDRN